MTQDDPLAELWLRNEDISNITDDDLMKIILFERRHRASGAKATKDKPESEAPKSLSELLPPSNVQPLVIRRR
jgi:hypothetical protein